MWFSLLFHRPSSDLCLLVLKSLLNPIKSLLNPFKPLLNPIKSLLNLFKPLLNPIKSIKSSTTTCVGFANV
jgi:hypothetical protein